MTLKLVQVYVTDKTGMPVRGLTKDDFTLTDNGRPIVITDFETHDLRKPAPGPRAAVAEEKPAPVPAAAPLRAETIRRQFIIFFDFAWNTQRGVAAGIKAALDFLDTKVAPEDDTALVSYSALKGLRIHESLTADKAKVRKAVATLTAREISGRAEEVEQAYWLLVQAAEDAGENGGAAEKVIREQYEPVRRSSMLQAEEYLRTLTGLAQALRLTQGQKHILFFSNGIPSSLINLTRTAGNDSPVRGASRGSTFEIGNSELSSLQARMLKEFSASNCSFYAFDTRESSIIPSLFASDEIQSQTRIMVERDIFRDDKTTGMDSLRTMAKKTGGKYYANIQRYEKNFEEVTAATGAYYVLGYSIPEAADGKFHAVKVEVKRKGCQVRTQPGYFNPKPFREYTDLEKDLHLFDLILNERSEMATENPLSLSALSFQAERGTRVQALARIPKTVWRKFEGKTVELVAVFFDEQDDLLSLQRAAVSPADYSGREVLFSAAAMAKPGAVKCRVVVRDLETGRSEVVTAKTYIASQGGQTLALFSPLLLAPGGGLYQLEGIIKGGPGGPSWHEVYVYDATAFMPVVGAEPGVRGRVRAIVPFVASSSALTDLVFKMNLVNSVTGAYLPAPFELRESASRAGLEVRNFDISLDAVSPGSYLLYIHATDKATGAQSSIFTSLSVAR